MAETKTQCAYKTEKGRQCKLVSGHSGQHRMVIRQEKVGLPAGLTLNAEIVPEGQRVTKTVTRDIPRDQDQKKVDNDALKAYNAWHKAGKPEVGKAPQLRYVVPPNAVDAVLAILRRSTATGAPCAGKRLTYRRGTHESGNVVIAFSVTDPVK